MTLRWAVKWRSRNRLDGITEHFMWAGTVPLLFLTRREARDYIRNLYGYIKDRPDLRAEPHGWRLPRAVKVHVHLREAECRECEKDDPGSHQCPDGTWTQRA